jgi:hypothetical protein
LGTWVNTLAVDRGVSYEVGVIWGRLARGGGLWGKGDGIDCMLGDTSTVVQGEANSGISPI